jgi:hypothetical protein
MAPIRLGQGTAVSGPKMARLDPRPAVAGDRRSARAVAEHVEPASVGMDGARGASARDGRAHVTDAVLGDEVEVLPGLAAAAPAPSSSVPGRLDQGVRGLAGAVRESVGATPCRDGCRWENRWPLPRPTVALEEPDVRKSGMSGFAPTCRKHRKMTTIVSPPSAPQRVPSARPPGAVPSRDQPSCSRCKRCAGPLPMEWISYSWRSMQCHVAQWSEWASES